MPSSIERILARLAALTAGTAAVSSLGYRAEAYPAPSPDTPQEPKTPDVTVAPIKIEKLVFARARGLPLQLAAHSSHSSHSSHASHSSHYSGSSGGAAPAPSPAPVQAPPTAPPPPAPVPAAPAVVAPYSPAERPPAVYRPSAAVLAKIPRLRNHWPKQVRLKVKAYFKLQQAGEDRGIRSLDAGALLPLSGVVPEHAIVIVDGFETQLPVEQCDLVERMGGEDLILSRNDDPLPSPANTPVERPDTVSAAIAQASGPTNAELLQKLQHVSTKWPKEVTVLNRTEFPVYDSGRIVGTGSIQPNIVLRLIVIDTQGVVVMVGSAPALVPLEATDLVLRMGGATAVMALPSDPP